MIKKMDAIYHLSHIDLDGYSCQLITNEIFENIKFYNSNYGDEIVQKITKMIQDIESDDFENNFILITDLNLTIEMSELMLKAIEKSSKDITPLLLDHHKTGIDCDEAYDWYYMDVSRCATKITYDYFLDRGYDISHLEKYADVVNSVDIWLQDSEYFELGKVCMRVVSSAKEVNRVMFSKENNEYLFSLLKDCIKFFDYDNPHIVLDNELHFIKKNFFSDKEDDTLENLITKFIVKLLSKNKNHMSVTYNGYKGIYTYGVGNISLIGNGFLLENPEYDFFLDINGRKNISMRANNKVDVSQIAFEVFNGGGHANASGGRAPCFKSSFIYEDLRKKVQDIFDDGGCRNS